MTTVRLLSLIVCAAAIGLQGCKEITNAISPPPLSFTAVSGGIAHS